MNHAYFSNLGKRVKLLPDSKFKVHTSPILGPCRYGNVTEALWLFLFQRRPSSPCQRFSWKRKRWDQQQQQHLIQVTVCVGKEAEPAWLPAGLVLHWRCLLLSFCPANSPNRRRSMLFWHRGEAESAAGQTKGNWQDRKWWWCFFPRGFTASYFTD